MATSGISQSSANPYRNAQFTTSYMSKAVSRIGTTKRAEVHAIRSQELRLTTDKIGRYAARIRSADQSSKTTQDRFFDLLV